VDVSSAAIGSAHAVATCCWCEAHLVVAQVEQLRCWLCPRCYPRQTAWALIVQYSAKAAAGLGLKAGRQCFHVPLPSQVEIYECGQRGGNILWGGRAGAAKSVGVRNWLYHRSLSVPGHEALLLRENWDQLQDNHTSKMAYEVPQLGGRWLAGDSRAVFGKGSSESVISCGHMAEAGAVLRYRGGNKGAIAADEASLYPVDYEGISVLAELRTMARAVYTDRAGATVHPVFVCATNPGGPSAAWLKDMFIDHAPDFELFPRLRPVFDEATGEQTEGYKAAQWHYIPATLDNNPYIASTYRQDNLSGLSDTRYRQLAEGDWTAMRGAFFPEFQERTHVLEGVLM
jgi:hypothetical protein